MPRTKKIKEEVKMEEVNDEVTEDSKKNEDTRRIMICMTISENPFKFDAKLLKRHMKEMGSNLFLYDLEFLEGRRIILKNKQGFYSCFPNIPKYIGLNPALTSFILSQIECESEESENKKVLKGISDRIKSTAKQDEFPVTIDAYDNKVLGIGFTSETNQIENIKIFEGFKFREVALKIKYNTRAGLVLFSTVKVGLIAFSVEKDQLYILGETVEGRKTCILMDSIVGIKETDIPNKIYHDKYYLDIIKKMVAMSIKPEMAVKLRFDNEPEVAQKVRLLVSRRPLSAIEEDGEYLWYTDSICGINEFKPIIREFGSKCIVFEPERLVSEMKDVAADILKNYEEEK